ncbi:cellulase family glycosylhydrolase [Microlunatus ginsengisoli]|uniref:Glycoside hydrolase family 5 domain-containing protein n=1 Tax=Microlunatus ginsengisoli TaxID=363863 RepID=A0ABP6ZVW0_9ACTN
MGGLSTAMIGDRARVLRDGRPVVLRTATEHYGAILNGAFDYVAYLDLLAGSGGNLTRTFVLFRELQSAVNPYSTCKPESIDYLAPYPRTDAGRDDPTALDGQPRFDLDRWDDRFFERLHDFVGRAATLGVTVELTLFSNTYAEAIWELNPLHHANNVNGLCPIHWTEHITARDPDRLERQLALVDKIVAECRDHPNVIFEPCNEPGAGAPVEPPVVAVTQAEVNAWLDLLIARIRSTDDGRHLIAGQEAFRYQPWEQPLDRSMTAMDVDIVNVHPLPGTSLGGRTYELGRFMSGDLALAEVRDFCAAAAAGPKPVNLDEDNTASQYTEHFGWTIHRKRAWVAALSGCHYDLIDFTIRPGLPLGSPAAGTDLRSWTRFLGAACDRWGIAAAVPAEGPRLVDGSVVAVARSVGSIGNERVLLYLADAAEGTRRHPSIGPVSCTFEASADVREIRAFRPADGSEVASLVPDDDGRFTVDFVEDLLLELTS